MNAAEVSNKGLDFSIDATIIDTHDFNWNTTFTGTYLKNEVTDLSGLDFVAGAEIASGLGPKDGMTRVTVGVLFTDIHGQV